MSTKQSGKIIFQMLTLWFFHNKPCLLINMADELQNTSQFFRHFTVPSNPLDAQVPCPGPYLFYSIDMQTQFPHYRQPAVLPYQVPMPHTSPSMSSLPSSKSESTKNEENPQPGATKRNHGSNWTDVETRYLLKLLTISQSARKETALSGTPLQRSSIPLLKTREYHATALVRSVRCALNTFRTSTNE